MIVSQKKNFVFIHIPKTGGTSVKAVLQKYGTVSVYKEYKYRKPQTNKNLSKHAKACVIKDNIDSALWDSCFRFGVVRNPWDWFVSVYFYILRDPADKRHKISNELSFKEFSRWFLLDHKDYYPIKSGQESFLFSPQGNKLVNYIGRFERLDKCFAHVRNKIGVAHKLPHRNKTAHRPYRSYYDKETKYLVGDFFSMDVKRFNYDF